MAFLDKTGLSYLWGKITSAINTGLAGKVDIVSGKGLSSNDYTDAEKTKLAGIAEGANKTIVDSVLSTTSTNPVQNKAVNTALGNKVDKVSGKGLSTNDYTTAEKNKLAGIAAGAEVNTVDSVNSKTGAVVLTASDVGALSDDTVLADLATDATHRTVTDTEKATWNAKSNFSGNYNDLTNKPTIPSIAGLATETYVDTKVAGLVDSAPGTLDTLNELAAALGDDPNFATTIATQMGNKVDKVEGKGLSTNDYTTAEKTKLSGIADGANKTVVDSSLSSTSTNPVQNKIINTALASKVDVVSGKGLSTNDYTTTEKTKLAGIAEGANKTTVDTALSSTSTNPVQNKAVYTALAGKSDTNHTHSYAGSSSVGGAATSANKLNTNAGSVTQPVYFANGVPVATTYTLAKSVPADAVFTDTTYSAITNAEIDEICGATIASASEAEL